MDLVNNNDTTSGTANYEKLYGKEVFDSWYKAGMNYTYAYNTGCDDAFGIIQSVFNYMFDNTPGATNAAGVLPRLNAGLQKTFGKDNVLAPAGQ